MAGYHSNLTFIDLGEKQSKLIKEFDIQCARGKLHAIEKGAPVFKNCQGCFKKFALPIELWVGLAVALEATGSMY